jgi:hypothetical protein
MNKNREGNHEHYTRYKRHFCPKTERYTGADSLITAQRLGWTLMHQVVYREDILLRGSRFRTIYYFRLQRGKEQMMMPIISNPFVLQLIHRQNLRIMPHSRAGAIELEETVILPPQFLAQA